MRDLTSVFPSLSLPLYLSVGAAAAICLYTTVQLQHGKSKNLNLHSITPSPLKTELSKLSTSEISKLPYRLDHLPGGRDVGSPWGSVRVYEWGPEDGRKVLLVHGISTPCVSLGGVAARLVEKGCRVMLFDLFGRGYSDNPTHHEHTTHLYTSLILTVLASSTISWTGTNAFSIIGYSLGGGIAASFTSSFPGLVSSLVLISSSGILREKHIAWQSRILYHTEGILPESLVLWLVRRRLTSPTQPADEPGVALEPEDGLVAEGGGEADRNAPDPLKETSRIVQWQLQHHMGFVQAFVSSIRHAPITNQHSSWAKIGVRLSHQKNNPNDEVAQREGMEKGKVVLVLGQNDPIIIREEVEEDAKKSFGEDNVSVMVFDGDHEVPILMPEQIVEALWSFWES